MTIRHLKIFLAVAESGKMSLAAEQLFITQPSVSQAIRELEEHYQTPVSYTHLPHQQIRHAQRQRREYRSGQDRYAE